MTANADITVIPTGGVTPVDLADLAATVIALPTFHAPQVRMNIPLSYNALGGVVDFGLAKQTSVIETLSYTIDGSAYSPVGGSAFLFPDGFYGISFTTFPTASGVHTVVVTGDTSGATDSAAYTV